MNQKRCPACGSVRLDWFEYALGVMHFSQDERGVDPEGYPNAPDPFKVEGECQDCRHRWTVPGARQIWDIPGHPDYTPPSKPNPGGRPDNRRRPPLSRSGRFGLGRH